MFALRIKRERYSWQASAAFACFATAIIAGTLGILLTTDWILNAQRHPLLYGLGLTLLILALPILILGGHFLDLMSHKQE